MVGHDYTRSSHSPTEVTGKLNPEWYRSFEAYIPRKVQIIAATVNNLDTLFISTAAGLYALSTDGSTVRWVYPTELPLGNSPTLTNNILYVGGYDRRIHAINASDGKLKSGWTFYEAGAGFETNPMVVNNTVYAGNRDGYFYALDANTGTLKWRFQTNGPILFSAAYKDNTLYFASNDSYAYAVNATTGQQVWKSVKFPGMGFHTWWPVIYTEPLSQVDYVIFAGSNNYRVSTPGYDQSIGSYLWPIQEADDIMSPSSTGNVGPAQTEPYVWRSGTTTMDNSKTIDLFETTPNRRTLFVLNRANGQEYRFDSDGDGKLEFAPITYAGITHSGNRFPPIIGGDGVLYQTTFTYRYAGALPKVALVGWKFGTKYVSLPFGSYNQPIDEPQVFSAGGNTIYSKTCCDRITQSTSLTNGTLWEWYNWHDLHTWIPNYNQRYWNYNGTSRFGATNGIGANGVYGDHGVQNPPIPFKGKVYDHGGNSVFAWGPSNTRTQLAIVPLSNSTLLSSGQTAADVSAKLNSEIDKILNAGGLLRPGYYHTGLYEGDRFTELGPNLSDYFRNPSDTMVTLLRALPHLDSTRQAAVRAYLQKFNCVFPLTSVSHIGWNSGTNAGCSNTTYGLPRETFITPNDNVPNPNYNNNIAAQMAGFGSKVSEDPAGWNSIHFWYYPPMTWYAQWKYCQEFGCTTAQAATAFNALKSKWTTNLGGVPGNSNYVRPVFSSDPANTDEHNVKFYPYILNAYVNGAIGYMQLEKMAGLTSDISQSSIYSTYQTWVNIRTTQYSKDAAGPFTVREDNNYKGALNVMKNFAYMTPELAQILRQQVLSKVQENINEIDVIAPYWFVSKYDSTRYEGELQQLYDYWAVYQARALILKEPYSELVKYLDVPAFERGDLFYIDNLVAALEAAESEPQPTSTLTTTLTPPPIPGDATGEGHVDGLDYVVWLNHYNTPTTNGASDGDFNSSGNIDGLDYVIWLNNYGS